MEGSLSEFRQMAHVSAQISHDHMATAFHFLISKRGAVVVVVAAAAALDGAAAASVVLVCIHHGSQSVRE